MKFIPMLYSAPMVQALLVNRKTKTRRIVKGLALQWLAVDGFTPEFVADPANGLCPYGKPGDIVWVRETIYQNGELGLEYAADNESIDEVLIPADFNVRVDKYGRYKFCKIPNIYMEKWACRIFLQVKSVRIERLLEISESDAVAEGIENLLQGMDLSPIYLNYTVKRNDLEKDHWSHCADSAIHSFVTLWESINGKYSAESNPWVWVVEFEKIEKPENFI